MSREHLGFVENSTFILNFNVAGMEAAVPVPEERPLHALPTRRAHRALLLLRRQSRSR